MLANYWKNGIAISGEIKFVNKNMIFTANSWNTFVTEIVIDLLSIKSISYETVLGKLFRITMINGLNHTFTVTNRDRLKEEIEKCIIQ